MDKRERIEKIAQMPEDRLTLARVLDKYEQARRRGFPTATGFLSPREQALTVSLLNASGIQEGFRWDGGYGNAERKVLLFIPADVEEWAEPKELCFFRVAFHGEESVSHRSLLGSLMGLGITREKIGDILVSPHSADVVASSSLAAFLLTNWDSAGRTRLTITEIERESLQIPDVQVRTIRDTLSSLRLDAAVAAAFSMSRGKAAEMIANGRVSLDYLPCGKADKTINEGSILTVRGLGRAVIRECGRISKKGRIIITIDRYG